MFNNKRYSGKIFCGTLAASSVTAFSVNATGMDADSVARRGFLDQSSGKILGVCAVLCVLVVVGALYYYFFKPSLDDKKEEKNVDDDEEHSDDDDNSRLATVKDFNRFYSIIKCRIRAFAKGLNLDLQEDPGSKLVFHPIKRYNNEVRLGGSYISIYYFAGGVYKFTIKINDNRVYFVDDIENEENEENEEREATVQDLKGLEDNINCLIMDTYKKLCPGSLSEDDLVKNINKLMLDNLDVSK